MPLLLLVLAVLLLPLSLHAQNGGFTATLTAAQQAATGLAGLNDDQRAAVNVLVAREVALARQGNVRAFAGTFSGRRTAQERAEAGLDRLAPEQLAHLDELVATAIAAGPVQPSIAQRLRPSEVAQRRPLEVHGEVSLAYGWSRRGDFRAASLYTEVHDPESKVTIGIGISQAKGDAGWWDCTDEFGLSLPATPLEFRHWTDEPHRRW